MLISEIVSALGAVQITESNADCTEIDSVFAGDLMSDVLAMVQLSPETTLLVTGLCNMQTINTVSMLDIGNIILCRNKFPNDQMIESGNHRGIGIYCTEKSMYEVCGLLYQMGLNGVEYE